MTATIERGRRITLAIAVWLTVVPSVLRFAGLALSRRPVPPGAWTMALVWTAVNLTLGWLLYSAYSWVRWTFIVWLLASTVVPTVRVLQIARTFTTVGQFTAVVGLVLAGDLVNVVVIWILWRSPSVVAYFERRSTVTTLSLTA
jgi:hypothetical protein